MDYRDDLTVLTWTVAMEASGETYEGKLAVAFTICNRARTTTSSVMDVCFKPWQFSAWNTDSVTRRKLDDQPPAVMLDSFKASCAAYFAFVPDPTKGSTHYLNEVETRKLNDGQLPSWYREDEVRTRIGKHTFLVA